jgi:hypothetical protein
MEGNLMSVGSWQPDGEITALDAAVVTRLCAAAASEAPAFGLSAAEISELAVYARDGGAGSPVDWGAAAGPIGADLLVGLIRLFTRAEMAFPAWKGGDRSPVIALAAELKKRGCYPQGLNAWIRANSDNRFLPYGSLTRRL